MSCDQLKTFSENYKPREFDDYYRLRFFSEFIQTTYPNLKATCHKLLENLLAKYLISVAAPLNL